MPKQRPALFIPKNPALFTRSVASTAVRTASESSSEPAHQERAAEQSEGSSGGGSTAVSDIRI